MSEVKSAVKIYELPFDVDKELCRLLDHDNLWKKAAKQMKYSAFEIDDMEINARRFSKSPTSELFSRWGQHNHDVDELVVALYSIDKNPYIPALICLKPYVSERFKRLVTKWQNQRNGVRNKESDDVHGMRPHAVQNASQSSIPLPVILIEQGNLQSSHHKVHSLGFESEQSTSNDNAQDSKSFSKAKNDLMEQVAAIPSLDYDSLKVATNNWDPSNLLGSGGFGQVFKGQWNFLTVAVKRLTKNENNKELIREMCLNQYRHDNILPLYGYSLGGPESLLVYQLMSGGSLQDRLRCKAARPPLTWPQRHRIAHGVARGLLFLHTMSGAPLIHGDIKPANILLDQCSTPKIGDFGLARKGPHREDRTHLKVSTAVGTRPYLPDEYLRSHCLSPAVDVFSYGVVMMEMATGLPAMDSTRKPVLLSDFIHLLSQEAERHTLSSLEDRRITNIQESRPLLFKEFIQIGVHCTKERRRRPSMLDVFKRLDALDFQGRNID